MTKCGLCGGRLCEYCALAAENCGCLTQERVAVMCICGWTGSFASLVWTDRADIGQAGRCPKCRRELAARAARTS